MSQRAQGILIGAAVMFLLVVCVVGCQPIQNRVQNAVQSARQNIQQAVETPVVQPNVAPAPPHVPNVSDHLPQDSQAAGDEVHYEQQFVVAQVFDTIDGQQVFVGWTVDTDKYQTPVTLPFYTDVNEGVCADYDPRSGKIIGPSHSFSTPVKYNGGKSARIKVLAGGVTYVGPHVTIRWTPNCPNPNNP